ncbi:GlsB/YeaQ/YmgE family stress response membrane protein [Rahnella woolbedingensis]|uniref:GlsB/YeaQ/YmgE family stress response membrane protein n=1 Tax=Rahnella woolbedingensis TaxID=1510574 RepID=A0A419N2Z7_9GAMM|nr:GlsB/YeaQ/YmgE family stress response membrane protein [Rahnella woolbedingensis]RJT35126.1 GlsB/YeaQ/YmgE family stress response membrane protein [Rahnella woolbedingensis]
MGILIWIVFGLVAGIIAKFIMPGRENSGFIMTIVLGIIGAVVGGYLASLAGIGNISGFNVQSMVIAVVGAIIVLFIYRKLTR